MFFVGLCGVCKCMCVNMRFVYVECFLCVCVVFMWVTSVCGIFIFIVCFLCFCVHECVCVCVFCFWCVLSGFCAGCVSLCVCFCFGSVILWCVACLFAVVFNVK